jgi:hypothetical protein
MMSGSKCTGCGIVGYVTLAVYAVITLITLYAAYNTHFMADGSFVAGAPEGSLALLTVLFSFHMLVKAFKKCCPCGSGCGTEGGGCCK